MYSGFHSGSDGKEFACSEEDMDLIPKSGEGNGYPL